MNHFLLLEMQEYIINSDKHEFDVICALRYFTDICEKCSHMWKATIRSIDSNGFDKYSFVIRLTYYFALWLLIYLSSLSLNDVLMDMWQSDILPKTLFLKCYSYLGFRLFIFILPLLVYFMGHQYIPFRVIFLFKDSRGISAQSCLNHCPNSLQTTQCRFSPKKAIVFKLHRTCIFFKDACQQPVCLGIVDPSWKMRFLTGYGQVCT